jgi:hypothetical protein
MTTRVELFCEDSAHESCARALVERIAAELNTDVSIHTATAGWGLGRLKQELRAFQSLMSRSSGTPHILVILVDANEVGPAVRRSEIEQIIDPSVFPEVVIGTPNPYVERWLLADPASFAATFGVEPTTGKATSRHTWKDRLLEALENAGVIVIQGGSELAEEIFENMDFYRAGKADQTIQSFTDDLRHALTRLAD